MSALRKIVVRSSRILRRSLSTKPEGRILSSGYSDVDIPKISINECVFEFAGKWGDKIAAECGFTGRKYTYDDLRKKSRNLNRSLRKKLKLSKGDVIASLVPNIPEYPIVVFGALRAGLTVTTINPLYTTEEIVKQLKDSGAKAIVTTVGLFKNADSARKELKKDLPIVTVRTEVEDTTPTGAINFSEFADEELSFDDPPYASSNDLAFLPYSSGTTGLPKGVELTHYNIVSNILQINHPEYRVIRDTTESHQDVIPAILPMFHIYGLTGIMLQSLRAGCKVVALPKFTTESYIKMLEDYRPHVLYLAPPIVLFLTKHPDVTVEHLKSIRCVVSGAAPLAGSDEKDFLEKAQRDIDIIQGYGLSETSPLVLGIRVELKRRLQCYGTVGTPVVNTLAKIVSAEDPNGPPLPPGESGELVVKGPQVMRGYRNRPEENAKAFTDDGWFRTGDLAYYDDNGLVYITDRLKELIKVKGFQVPPAELEGLIRSFKDVADAAVIGVPHEIYGEVPRAYVVPKQGKQVDVDALVEFVEGKVASFKRLKGGVEVMESIPKNAAGKILRRVLKEEYLKKQGGC